VREVLVDDEAKQATVIVPDDQLSLAIGREGQNARLAARLTGWRVDIRSETEFAAEEAEHGYEEEEVQGRCAAILSNGRRCPNAVAAQLALLRPGHHQALAGIDSDNIADLAPRAVDAEQPSRRSPRTPGRGDAVEPVERRPRHGVETETEPGASRAGRRPPRSRRHSRTYPAALRRLWTDRTQARARAHRAVPTAISDARKSRETPCGSTARCPAAAPICVVRPTELPSPTASPRRMRRGGIPRAHCARL
jgi:hypothetical protein